MGRLGICGEGGCAERQQTPTAECAINAGSEMHPEDADLARCTAELDFVFFRPSDVINRFREVRNPLLVVVFFFDDAELSEMIWDYNLRNKVGFPALPASLLPNQAAD